MKRIMNQKLIESFDNAKINTLALGEGNPILFLNGMRSSLSCWKNLVQNLSSRYQCVCFDPRGVGKSDKPDFPYYADHHSSDIEAVIDSFSISKAVLIGHSIGAMRAIDFAIKFPEKVSALILINAGAHLNMGLKLMMKTTLKALETGNKDLLDAMSEIGLAITFGEKTLKELEPRFDDFVDSAFAGVTLESAKNLYKGVLEEDIDYRNQLHKIKVPTLIVAGDEDLQFPLKYSQEMQQLVPDSKLQILKGCGHFALTEKTEELNLVINNFLEKL